jgi:type II secretory pathway pseudopilin PulG
MLNSRATFVVVVMSLLAVGVVTTLWLSTQATAGTYKLEQVRQDVAALGAQVAQARSDVAAGRSPASLAAKARQLGMVPAGVPAHLVVGEDGKVTVVGTPSKVTPPPSPAPPKDPPASPTPPGGGGNHQQAAPNPEGGGE